MRAAKVIRGRANTTTAMGAGDVNGRGLTAHQSQAPELLPEDCCVHLVQVREHPPGQPPPPEAFDIWIFKRGLCRLCTANPVEAFVAAHGADDPAGCAAKADAGRASNGEDLVREMWPESKASVLWARSESKMSSKQSISTTQRAESNADLQSRTRAQPGINGTRLSRQRAEKRRGRKQLEHGTTADLGRTAFRLCMELKLVQDLKAKFDDFDVDKCGLLDKAAFIEMIRSLTSESDEAVELLVEDCWFPRQHDDNDEDPIDFEGFLEWYQAHSFDEALALPPTQRELRKYAHAYGVDVAVAEEIHTLFERFDEDGSGAIEYDEFQRLMAVVLGARDEEIPKPMMSYFWRQCCPHGAGGTSLEGLLQWYGTQFAGRKQDGISLIEGFYRSQRPLAGNAALARCGSQPF